MKKCKTCLNVEDTENYKLNSLALKQSHYQAICIIFKCNFYLFCSVYHLIPNTEFQLDMRKFETNNILNYLKGSWIY